MLRVLSQSDTVDRFEGHLCQQFSAISPPELVLIVWIFLFRIAYTGQRPTAYWNRK
jgi:hypothetical protein